MINIRAAKTTIMKTHRGLLVFLLAMAQAVGRRSSQKFLTWDVHVVNGLSGGKTLFIHCKSEDNDLGMQNPVVGDEFLGTSCQTYGGQHFTGATCARKRMFLQSLMCFWNRAMIYIRKMLRVLPVGFPGILSVLHKT